MTEKLMNFLPKHIPNIIAGVKTQSRRLKKEGEIFEYYVDEKGKAIYPIEVKAVMRFKTQKIKFAVGEVRQVAVKGTPVWYCPETKEIFGQTDNRNLICRSWEHRGEFVTKGEIVLDNGIIEQADFFITRTVRVAQLVRDAKEINSSDLLGETCGYFFTKKLLKVIPLKIKILSIKPEERLMNITNADAVAEVGEGLKYPRAVFFREFLECYRDKIPKKILDDTQKLTVDVLFDPLAGTIGPMTITQAWNPLEWPIEFEVVE